MSGGDKDHPDLATQADDVSNSNSHGGSQSSPLNKIASSRSSEMAAAAAPAAASSKPQELTLSYLCEQNQSKLGLGFDEKGKEAIFSAEANSNGGSPSSPLNKIDSLKDSNMAAGTVEKPPQELTLSYLCDNNQPKLGLGFGEKGKEVVFSKGGCSDRHQEKWVERDFLNLSETEFNSCKRNSHDADEEAAEGEDEAGMEKKKIKKPKLEGSLNLSLALPDVSLSLPASNALLQIGVKAKPVGLVAPASVAPAPSNNNTQTTCSDDFTAPCSLSCSFSHAFSHNPSCSMTRNSTENYRDDPIWCGGEGTNGSVHSRFRPIGDGIVALHSNNEGINGGFGVLQGNRVSNKDSCNNDSVCRATSSDNISFYPSVLPARPRMDTYSGDSRKKDSGNLRGLEDGDGGGRGRKQLSRPERIVREIVSESIPVMAQIIQELTQEMLNSIRDYVKDLVSVADKREELVTLQNRLNRRSDLTKESLLKCQRNQLEILVAVRMGLVSFMTGKLRLATTELIEMFLFVRCRNVNCKSILPVEDCDCKFCSADNGFCSSCMCAVCMKFDCASNTCSWVGCDVCSHWCHAACGVQKNLVRPGPSLKGPPGTSEIQFHCIACNHASEMFGFVKDVFTCCAKDWGFETLLKELDCVRKIFRGSDDFKGKELHTKADGLISKLESKLISPSDACHIILKFFNYADRLLGFPAGPSVKEMMPRNTESSIRKESATPIPQYGSLPPRYAVYNNNNNSNDDTNNSVSGSSTGRLGNEQLKTALLMGDMKMEDSYRLSARKDAIESLESIVRMKEAESRMFQSKADEARREADGLRRIIQFRTEKFEDEYAHKLSRLCLQDTEERRRKKLDELKKLESSQCEYHSMKLRMQAEIAGLLKRMEATKQQWV
ncbi:unnamed protein product [Linum trigynum]|uniref:Protein OBERON 3 n=1 Tax=Linum trigynum TaxID=586398 RepID=A0AAV2GCY2_9ROSI